MGQSRLQFLHQGRGQVVGRLVEQQQVERARCDQPGQLQLPALSGRQRPYRFAQVGDGEQAEVGDPPGALVAEHLDGGPRLARQGVVLPQDADARRYPYRSLHRA